MFGEIESGVHIAGFPHVKDSKVSFLMHIEIDLY